MPLRYFFIQSIKYNAIGKKCKNEYNGYVLQTLLNKTNIHTLIFFRAEILILEQNFFERQKLLFATENTCHTTVGLLNKSVLNKSASPNQWLSITPTIVLVLNATGFISGLLNKSFRWILIINDLLALVTRRKRQIEESRSALIERPADVSNDRAFLQSGGTTLLGNSFPYSPVSALIENPDCIKKNAT